MELGDGHRAQISLGNGWSRHIKEIVPGFYAFSCDEFADYLPESCGASPRQGEMLTVEDGAGVVADLGENLAEGEQLVGGRGGRDAIIHYSGGKGEHGIINYE